MSNSTNGSGAFFLMHGTSTVQSSATFESQFVGGSTMTVVQDASLYARPASTVFDQTTFTASRTLADYYTPAKAYKAGSGSVTTLASGSNSFTYNSAGTAETFTNTVKTGTLTITNTEVGNAPGNTSYTFRITLEDVFGGTADVSTYSSVVASKNGTTMNLTQGAGYGTFTLQDGDTLTISGIPYGTKYKVTEVTSGLPSEWIDHTGSMSTAATLNQSAVSLPFVNNYPTHTDITVEKTGESGDDMEAEFKLYYKDTENPVTYTPNDPETVPNQKVEKKLPQKSGISVPDPEPVTTPVPVETTEITYGTDSHPTASDKDWILPRNDSDYIYFRDYNVNSSALGEHDQRSFQGSNSSNPQTAQSGNRSWRYSWLKTDSGHSQNLEIGFGDENQGAWVAAQFTKNGSNMVQYAVWERFVDKYSNVDTVVWKIQPPDGYNKVRFCLYYGSQCIRTTEEFTFELGRIYHKTSWGRYYSYQNNRHCYWDVPVEIEQSGSDNYWAPEDSSPYDKRANNSTMNQARKYEPTEQKVIFHCNSNYVWHNIHIEFFTDAAGTQRVNGQSFPGYMMEPYAYGGSDYRVGKYLTYELTIPKNAVSFRITNGVATDSTYGYYTAVTQLRTATSNNGAYAKKKNYANYYKLSNQSAKYGGTLTEWSNGPEGLPNASYKTQDVDSDYDYIYFEKPSNWSNHVYAYFYGGGDLRKDNWQRACYSAWPGVAAAGTEYIDNGTQYYSTTYTYSVTGSGNQYNGSGTPANISPETTFQNSSGKTIYKFRVPKGDRKNYSKVIFNDGLRSNGNGGKYETGVIDYSPGYLYTSNGSGTKHYDNKPTVTYTARSGNDDYIYVKMNASTYNNWDDLHITFYDSNNNRILQGGHGYVMDYSGTSGGYKYFRIPIPTAATKFKLNNGINKPRETGMYDILRKAAAQDPVTSKDYTTGKLIYELTGNSLTRTEPNFTETTVAGGTTYVTGSQQSGVDFTNTVRNDSLKILDDADPAWDIGIGTGKVNFYNSSGQLIGGKAYTLIQSKPDANGDRWYTVEIPDAAASFTLTYPDGTTSEYEIFPYSTNGVGQTGSWTSDGMYYHTQSDGTLAIIESTIQSTDNTADAKDETYSKRGDFLYLICETSQKATWDTTGQQNPTKMRVTFYGGDGSPIVTDVTAKYINEKDSDTWYKVSIPKAAAFFLVKAVNGSPTETAEIYELRSKESRYRNDYTTGDMQYRLPSAATGAPELVYPIYTEDDEYTLEVNGEKISSGIKVHQVDESAVSGYANSDVGTTPPVESSATYSGSFPTPVLYNTTAVTSGNYQRASADLTNVTKAWTETTTTGSLPSDTNIYFYNSVGWSSVVAHFNTGNVTMTRGSSADSNGFYTYSCAFDASASTVWFSNGSSTSGPNRTQSYTISSSNIGYTSKYTPTQTAGLPICIDVTDINAQGNGNWYAHFWKDGGGVYSPDPEGHNANGDGSSSSVMGQWWTIPAGYNRVQFYRKENGTETHRSNTLTLDSSNNYGRGRDYKWYTSGYLGTTSYSHSNVGNSVGYVNGSWTAGVSGGIVTVNTNYSSSYQIEDRYGFVTDINGTGDTNNFIYIQAPGSSYVPYVKFYTDTAGTTGEIGGIKEGESSVSIGIKTDSMGSNKYRIRIPKNAKSFKIANGKDGSFGSAIPLYEDLNVSASTGQIASSGDLVAIDDFHHAGTTFTVDSSGTVTSKTLRSGYTQIIEKMEDPLNPRSDADYIFFTDNGGTFANSGQVYAYFYGDVDGEYMYDATHSWPGEKAMTPNTGYADTTYTDNAGKKVYAFRIPKGNEGKYTKVIFTNGNRNTTNSNIKITAAQDIVPGGNYIVGSSNGQYYGAFAVSGKVFAISSTLTKNSEASTVDYDLGIGTTFYFINNGTQNISSSGVEDGRYQLDELHVVFYDASGTPVGNTTGYKPDKIIGEQFGAMTFTGSPLPTMRCLSRSQTA